MEIKYVPAIIAAIIAAIINNNITMSLIGRAPLRIF